MGPDGTTDSRAGPARGPAQRPLDRAAACSPLHLRLRRRSPAAFSNHRLSPRSPRLRWPCFFIRYRVNTPSPFPSGTPELRFALLSPGLAASLTAPGVSAFGLLCSSPEEPGWVPTAQGRCSSGPLTLRHLYQFAALEASGNVGFRQNFLIWGFSVNDTPCPGVAGAGGALQPSPPRGCALRRGSLLRAVHRPLKCTVPAVSVALLSGRALFLQALLGESNRGC